MHLTKGTMASNCPPVGASGYLKAIPETERPFQEQTVSAANHLFGQAEGRLQGCLWPADLLEGPGWRMPSIQDFS